MFSLTFYYSYAVHIRESLRRGWIVNAAQKTLSLFARGLMGVCLCVSVCAWGCLCPVPSSISEPLPFSDGH